MLWRIFRHVFLNPRSQNKETVKRKSNRISNNININDYNNNICRIYRYEFSSKSFHKNNTRQQNKNNLHDFASERK